MAHKKGEGSSKNGRDSHAQRLGVKLFGGQQVVPGNIIVRQRGTKYFPGSGVMMGKDHTIFATKKGIINFQLKRGERNYISIISPDETKVS
ncbi:MAG: 50S ribosomal protein L27 [Chitinophagales bacterium]|nr:50S ribosomal protein L27 [Chitinophagales bacterium]